MWFDAMAIASSYLFIRFDFLSTTKECPQKVFAHCAKMMYCAFPFDLVSIVQCTPISSTICNQWIRTSVQVEEIEWEEVVVWALDFGLDASFVSALHWSILHLVRSSFAWESGHAFDALYNFKQTYQLSWSSVFLSIYFHNNNKPAKTTTTTSTARYNGDIFLRLFATTTSTRTKRRGEVNWIEMKRKRKNYGNITPWHGHTGARVWPCISVRMFLRRALYFSVRGRVMLATIKSYYSCLHTICQYRTSFINIFRSTWLLRICFFDVRPPLTLYFLQNQQQRNGYGARHTLLNPFWLEKNKKCMATSYVCPRSRSMSTGIFTEANKCYHKTCVHICTHVTHSHTHLFSFFYFYNGTCAGSGGMRGCVCPTIVCDLLWSCVCQYTMTMVNTEQKRPFIFENRMRLTWRGGEGTHFPVFAVGARLPEKATKNCVRKIDEWKY